MTLPLHRKRRTTRLNIRPATALRLCLARGGAFALCLAVILVITSPATAEDSPLDQLRERSAEKRWKTLRERVAERREERKDRKADSGSPGVEAAAEKPEAGHVPAVAAQPDDAVPTVLLPPSVNVPNAAAMVPPAPPQRELTEISQAPTSESLYRELFQLETASEQQAAQQDSAAEATPGSTVGSFADPHPALLSPAKILAQPVVLPAPAAPQPLTQPLAQPLTTATSPGLMPLLPLPGEDGSDFRIASQPQTDSTPAIPRQSFQGYLFESADYFKEMSEIMPFADYDPGITVQEETIPEEYQAPEIASLPDRGGVIDRNFAHVDFAWKASDINYYPLYFEDVNLERYGHQHHPAVQPFVSVGKFGGQLLALPYQMTMNQVYKPTYPLGYLPPGDEGIPKVYYRVPVNAKAAMVTAGVYTGWFFLIP